MEQLWQHDKWTYFILRPWVSLPITIAFTIVCVMYATLREPSREWEDNSKNWRARVWKPPSTLGTLWFTLELIACTLTGASTVGEVVRLSTGMYSTHGWTTAAGIGVYMWYARVEVFVALLGCSWDFYRFAHLHAVEMLYLASHIWLTGTWLSCPHSHSTVSVVIPFAFVIDRAIFAAYRIQVERGVEQPVDISRGPGGTSHAGKALLHGRRSMRLLCVLCGTPLFFWHEFKGNHHGDAYLHRMTTGMYIVLVLMFELVSKRAALPKRAAVPKRASVSNVPLSNTGRTKIQLSNRQLRQSTQYESSEEDIETDPEPKPDTDTDTDTDTEPEHEHEHEPEPETETEPEPEPEPEPIGGGPRPTFQQSMKKRRHVSK
jgi:hypothetical protein